MHIGKTAGNHATLGAVNYQARELGPWPDLQVAGTVDVMRDRAREDAQGEGFKVRAKEIAGTGLATFMSMCSGPSGSAGMSRLRRR